MINNPTIAHSAANRSLKFKLTARAKLIIAKANPKSGIHFNLGLFLRRELAEKISKKPMNTKSIIENVEWIESFMPSGKSEVIRNEKERRIPETCDACRKTLVFLSLALQNDNPMKKKSKTMLVNAPPKL